MSVSAARPGGVAPSVRPMTSDEKKIILASSLGTVFEWYDFYLYGSLAVIIGAKFFGQFDETTRNIFALLAFAAGFLVRPFGALVFGRLGDLVGRKYTFLVTILIMGSSTFIVGILPTSDSIGITAAVILISLRMLQGLAIGGEYGGAATYVAEHAPAGRRGFYTSWIQTTATLGLFMSLLVILLVQASMSGDDFKAYGWRIPFLVSVLLLAVSVWIRLQLSESPAFLKMKAEGRHSKAPLSEAFGQWANAKWAILALFGLVAGQAVVWYSGQFYALFFLTGVLKVDGFTANLLVAWALLVGAFGFILFGWLSDKIGRKPIILGGCLLAALTYFPVFKYMAETANPALTKAQETVQVVVVTDPADCSFQFNPTGLSKFVNSCDLAKGALARASVTYSQQDAPPGTKASVKIGDKTLDPTAKSFAADLAGALTAVGYPSASNPSVVKIANPFDIFRAAAVHAGADVMLPDGAGHDGLRSDGCRPGGAVSDPHPLHLHVATVSYWQRLVRRLAASLDVRNECSERQYLFRVVVSDRDCRGDRDRGRSICSRNERARHLRRRFALSTLATRIVDFDPNAADY